MKTLVLFKYSNAAIFFLLSTLVPAAVLAQQSIEFTSGAGNPSGNGPQVSGQQVVFQANTNNPVGNTFIDFNPQVSTSFSFNNQQYTLPAAEVSTGMAMNFGASRNPFTSTATSVSLFSTMNTVASASSSQFTSVGNGTPGTGIDVSTNRTLSVFNSVRPLYHAGASTDGRYYYGDLTITFSKFVINPVIHIVGLGEQYVSGNDTLGFTTELELKVNTVQLSRLSGTPELQVTPSKILHAATHPGSGLASGSILVTGAVRTITFRVYLRGDGGTANWSDVNMHPGDFWMMGLSSLASTDLPLPVKLSGFTATLGHQNKAELAWSTATEINASHFVVERSTDGSHFTEAGLVFAFGNSTDNIHYSFSDNLSALTAGTIWYRLRSVDMDGHTEYSATRIIRRQASASAGIRMETFPNPATTELRVTVPAEWQGKPVVYELLSLSGQVVKRMQTGNSGQVETIPVSGIAPGVYIARVICEGQSARQKIVKQ